MSLNNTPSSERLHIGIFGSMNAGKSSIINAITSQSLSIVSEVKGTTTDPVLKTMELLPLGPVVIIDTPGIDDESTLGKQRIEKAFKIFNKTDIAVLVIDATVGFTTAEFNIIKKFEQKKLPFLIVMNKNDLEGVKKAPSQFAEKTIYVSALLKQNIYELKERITELKPKSHNTMPLLSDLVKPLDFVVLVIPIDSGAPKGRLILPQQQVVRAILDVGAMPIIARETELDSTLKALTFKPALVITDSQAFEAVSKIVPEDILLTSFSILFARYKGHLEKLLDGIDALNNLEDEDTVLIAEGCTHHRQCDDIGTVKLPRLISNYTNKKLNFLFTSGTEFPDKLDSVKLVVHCGGCMITEREVKYRIDYALAANIPVTNYGMLFAQFNNILKRSIKVFNLK